MNLCVHCGYDLAGRQAGERCPECGRRVRRDLRGGLAAGGARFARPAARTALVVAALTSVAAVSALTEMFVSDGGAVLWTIWHQGRFLALFVGAYLCALVARMLPRDSAWSRVMWLAVAARIAWGGLGEFFLHVPAPAAAGPVLVGWWDVETTFILSLDMLVALGIVRVSVSGGISRVGSTAAWVAAGAAAYGLSTYGLLASRQGFAFDQHGVLACILRSGAPGSIACAVALLGIQSELERGGEAAPEARA